MKNIRVVFEERMRKEGFNWLDRNEDGSYEDDYVNGVWYGYLLWTRIKTNPNEI